MCKLLLQLLVLLKREVQTESLANRNTERSAQAQSRTVYVEANITRRFLEII